MPDQDGMSEPDGVSGTDGQNSGLAKDIASGLFVYFQPRIAVFLVFGIASGLPLGLAGDMLRTWVSEYDVSWTSIGLLSLAGLPYTIKFLWSPIVDRVPLPFLTRALGRRRSWIITTQIGLVVAIFALGQSDPAANLYMTGMIALVVAFISATQDIAIDAFRIETLEEEDLAAGTAIHVNGYMLASKIIGGAGVLYLAEFYSWSVAYSAMAIVMALCIIMTLIMPEPEQVEDPEALAARSRVEAWVRTNAAVPDRLQRFVGAFYLAAIAPFQDFMKHPGWIAILLFVVFYKFGDAMAGTLTNPFLLDIGFAKIEVANISKAFGLAATLSGLAAAGAMMKVLGINVSLWICGILQLVSNFVFAVQAMVGPDLRMLAFTIGFENLASGMGTAVFLAFISKLCNVSFTATQFALLTAFSAFARTFLASTAGPLRDLMAWEPFFIVTGFAALPGLFLLWWITQPDRRV